MEDPVIALDGNTYERASIEEWFAKNKTSPETNEKIGELLIPNRNLSQLITKFQEEEKAATIKEEEALKNALLAAEKEAKEAAAKEAKEAAEQQVEIDKQKKEIKDKKKKKAEEQKKSEVSVNNNSEVEINVSAFVDEKNYLRISTGIPDAKEAPPCDVVCVVDVSYSMGEPCSGVNDGHTQYVELAYSLIDLVRHAVKMIVNVLGEKDRLSMVLFTSTARIDFDFTEMNEQGKAMAHARVDAINKEQATNIYDGIKVGIDVIEKRVDKSRNPSVLFFTDGQANTSPQGGEIKALTELKEKLNVKYPVHTMGFGQYNTINSKMIFDIAKIFNGMNGYIPDPTCIGTVFVNAIANILTTDAMDTKLIIKVKGDGPSLFDGYECLGGDYVQRLVGDNEFHIDLACLRYGQNVDFLIKLSDQKLVDGKLLDVEIQCQSNGAQISKQWTDLKIETCDSSENMPHVLRYECIQLYNTILGTWQQGIEACHNNADEFYQKWKKEENEDDFYKGMIQTLERQTLVSLKKEKYMEKWGRHQYYQTIRALNLQYKGNFRDPCLAHFGGVLFEDITDRADDIFNGMPPPEESLKEQQAQRAAEVTRIENQAQFQQVLNTQQNYAGGGANDDSGCRGCGCFTGDSLIQMRDGSKKQVQSIKKGDHVKTPQGFATVRCLVKFHTVEGMAKICTLEKGLKITAGHPIAVNGRWVFPRQVVEPKLQRCEAVYNLVVDKDHVVVVNEVPLILMGHNYKEGILQHDYYGSQRVIQDFEKVAGWTQGFIEFNAGSFTKQRNSNRMDVCQSLVQN